MSERIPSHIIEDHKKGVEQLRFYGFPATELDRDELLAMVNLCAQELKEQRERFLGHLEFSRMLRTRAYNSGL